MLQAMTWASPPALRMPLAAASQASALRLEITTLAPSFAKSSAEERPMPRLEPVMMATLPVRSNGVPFTTRAPFLFRFLFSSWPGSSRPSTSLLAAKTWMPGTKAGHDDYCVDAVARLTRLDQSPRVGDAAQVIVGIAKGAFDHGQPLEVMTDLG